MLDAEQVARQAYAGFAAGDVTAVLDLVDEHSLPQSVTNIFHFVELFQLNAQSLGQQGGGFQRRLAI